MSGNEALMGEWTDFNERRSLGASVRRLVDAVVTTGASPSELGAAAAAIDRVTAILAATTRRPERSVAPEASQAGMSLVGGLAHPAAPQLTLEATPGGASGDVVVGSVFEGGPGLVHGGVVALLVDHAMGYVANQGLEPAMTVQLGLRYRRPTPLRIPLTVAARLDEIEGRKLHLSASVTANGELTAEADAIFLRLTPDNLDEVFPRPT